VVDSARIHCDPNLHEVLGWVNPPETFTNREVCDERTWMYSQRVSGGFTHLKTFHKESSEIQTSNLTAFLNRATHFTAPKKNPPGITN